MEQDDGFVPLTEGLTREEDARVRKLLANVGVGEDKVRVYSDDLMFIIEAGFGMYFRKRQEELDAKWKDCH